MAISPHLATLALILGYAGSALFTIEEIAKSAVITSIQKSIFFLFRLNSFAILHLHVIDPAKLYFLYDLDFLSLFLQCNNY